MAGKRKNLEEQFQRAVVEYLSGLNWFFWHTPNGGQRNPRTAAILQLMGVRPGVADLIIAEEWFCHFCEGIGIEKGRVCSNCNGAGTGTMIAIELKSPKGRLTDSQHVFLDQCQARGWLTCVARKWKDLDTTCSCVRPKSGRYYNAKKVTGGRAGKGRAKKR